MRADPDLASWVSEKGDQRQLQRTWDRAGSKLPSTEDGLAMLFADLYSDRLRYCHDTHRWHEWDGDLWRPQRTDLASHWVRLVCRDSAAQHQQNRLANVSTASGVEKFARADPAFAVEQTIRGSWVRRTARWTCGRDGCAHRCRLTRSARQPACRRHKWRIVRYGCTSWMR